MLLVKIDGKRVYDNLEFEDDQVRITRDLRLFYTRRILSEKATFFSLMTSQL